VSTVEIETSPTGTPVLLDRRLRREPVVDLSRTATRTVPPRRTSRMGVEVTVSSTPSITLSGPIDLARTEELRRSLWSASRGGALPLTVELGAVSYLGSAGIQVLYDFVEEMTAMGRTLRLWFRRTAPPGTRCG